MDPSLPTPRGSHAILAQQIDQEILELRNFFDDHREEMLFLISDQPQTAKKLTTSAGCSPIVFESQQKSTGSPKRSSRQVIIEKSRGEVSLMGQDTIENVSSL